ncbi:MAG: hypothetical protein D4R64_11680 [Porphyromonadaceae bacterium]|nr:MAG: hypothetical protein D4R64_11680 [Porphyromonadaceae bacterium]
MKNVLLGLFLCLPFLPAHSLNEKKQLGAVRSTGKITIDGVLNEPIWQSTNAARGFVTYSPTMGLPETQRTEVRVVYDNNAVYFGVYLYDTTPDSIMRELTKRDQVSDGNVDRFKISLNPYNNGQNLFQFEVSAANVQGDSKQSSTSSGGEDMYHHGDPSWNTVWYSKVNITKDGWVLEVEIPFAAIRFPKQDVQVWGINFQRTVRRTRETTTWNPVDRNFGEESQVGELVGIQSVKSPIRLELYPFAAGYYQFSPEGKGFSYAAGMDLKYGINNAYTLDMTLIPDFGQRKSDQIVLNLTPYEVQYQENRQFFTEGMELFDKSGLFYSRRIGKRPAGYYEVWDKLKDGETVVQNPEEAKLINVTKISGRNTKNLGIGFLNAMTANTYADVIDPDGKKKRVLTDPFSNYNMIVLDQVFGRNSYVNLTNTNVLTPSTTRMANVTNASIKLRDKANRYGISGSGAVSLIYDSLSGKPVTGHSMNFRMGKYGGALTAGYSFGMISDAYNPNDMGYLRNNNSIGHDLSLSYRFLEPFWVLNTLSNSLGLEYNMIYNPRAYSEFNISWSTQAVYRNYWDTRISLEYSPVEIHDWYEPRVANRYFVRPSYLLFNLSGSSDYRKKVAFQAGFQWFRNARGNQAFQYSIQPRFRLNNKLSFFPSVKYLTDRGDQGYVTSLDNGSLVFGQRDIKTITNSITGSFVFNNKSALSLSLRHYWSQVNYLQYYLLDSNGGLLDYPEYSGNPNLDFNIFNIDLEYALNFAPGSYLTVVWKNNISKSETIDNQDFLSYWENLQGTLISPQTNSFSIKVIYYLDYKRVLPGKNP